MSSRQRILPLDYLRGFAIILVIIVHSILTHPVDISHIEWCYVLKRWINTIHLPALFFVSGCVWSCKDLKTYYIKKADRILVPYLFISLLSGLMHTSGLSVINKHYDIGSLLSMIANGGTVWFLYVLFAIFLIYPAIDKVFKTCGMKLGLAIILMLILPLFNFPKTLSLHLFTYYLPYFILGTCASGVFTKHYTKLQLLLSALVCLAVYLMIFYHTINMNAHQLHCLRYIRALLMISFFSSLFIYYDTYVKEDCKISKGLFSALEVCSTYSLQIYLFNGFWLVLLRTLLCSYLNVRHPLLILTIIPTLNILTTILICKHFLPKFPLLNWLCGNGKLRKTLKQ